MPWVDDIMFWHWLLVGLTLVVLEILSGTYYCLWLGIAGFVVGVLMFIFPEMSLLIQVLCYGFVAVTSIVAYKRYEQANPFVSDEVFLNKRGDRYINQVFTLTEPIVNGCGQVKIGDSIWRVRGQDVESGKQVKVVSIDGVTLITEVVTQ